MTAALCALLIRKFKRKANGFKENLGFPEQGIAQLLNG
jgi:hypothetical protein